MKKNITIDSNNILQDHRSILRHFTDKKRIILFISAIVLLGSTNILPTSALEYSSNVGLEFDINPSISVSVSGDLSISNLSLGSASNSNEIVVSVSTNNVSGYNLTANVGNDSTYTSNSLLHSNGTSTFDSINYETSTDNYLSSLTTPSTWGYSIDSGTSYNGLPYKNNGAATLTATSTIPAGGVDTTNFLISALASSNQIAGEYNNVINFYATTNLPPISFYDAFAASGAEKHNGYYKMQDMSSTICSNIETVDEESQTQLIDVRDNKVYWVAKLQDGHCWMTQNLDLIIDTNKTYTSQDTDLTAISFKGNNFQDYTIDENNIISWKPGGFLSTPATINSYNPGSIPGAVPDWPSTNHGSIPAQIEGGDVYVYNSETTNYDLIYLSLSNCVSNNHNSSECLHYHIGNLYNWSAAIALNYSNIIYHAGAIAPNSICPSNWRLPSGIIDNNNSKRRSDYNYLLLNAGITDNIDLDGNANVGYIGNGFNKIRGAPYYFTRVNEVYSDVLSEFALTGRYWNNTINTDGRVDASLFSPSTLKPAKNDAYRNNAAPIRCLAR